MTDTTHHGDDAAHHRDDAARRAGIDQIDKTDDQGKIPARPQAKTTDPEIEKLEKPLGEAKEGPVDGVSPENTSGAAKGHW